MSQTASADHLSWRLPPCSTLVGTRLLISRFSTRAIRNSATHTRQSWRETKFQNFTSRMYYYVTWDTMCSFKRACQDDLGSALQSGHWAFWGRENSGTTVEVFLLAEPSTGRRDVHSILHFLHHCQTIHQEVRPLYSLAYP